MIKRKNYFILGVILLITIALVGYSLRWYSVYRQEQQNTAVLGDTIQNIKMDEFSTYITERHNAAIYFEITNDPACRSFESKFKKIIYQYQLKGEVVYISVNSLKEPDLAKSLDNKYNNEELRSEGRYFDKVPALAIFSDDKLVDFVNGSSLTTSRAVTLLRKYGFINEW